MRPTFTRCFFLLLFVLPTLLPAQDARFTQFYAIPQHMNPAFTGVYEGNYRFIANYRELYNTIMARTAYRSVGAHFDMRRPVGNTDYMGLGVSAMRDQAGIAKFVNQHAHVSASYLKQMGSSKRGGGQYLAAGAQLGYGQRGFDFNALWFSNQFDQETGRINTAAPTGEPLESGDMRPTSYYLDFNAGALYYATFAENNSFYIGGALYHLNQPNISFIDGQEETLNMRWVGQVGAELPFSDGFSLMPAVAVMGQGPNMSTTAGANFRYSQDNRGEIALRLGAWANVGNQLEQGMLLDNIAVTAFLELEQWDLGLSYDITTSKLKMANNSRGGFEVSLIYTGKPTSRREKLLCPNF